MPTGFPLGLVGKRFGRLLVYARSDKPRTWRCTCDCGISKEVRSQLLVTGSAKSCGCLRREVTAARSRTHGMSNSRERTAWKSMRNRCYRSQTNDYERYGGRGITVCDRWRDSFQNFYDDMGPIPSPEHSLDRIDNDGPYSPENCRWASPEEQARNKSTTRWLEFRGERRRLMEWAELLGIPENVIYKRLNVRGWSVDRALSTPHKR